MNRNQLLSILKINGLTLASPEEDIRAVLQNAKYTDFEIDAALNLLREKNTIDAGRVDGLHRVFYTDASLRPSEISSLLGIDVKLDVPVTRWTRSEHLTTKEVLTITIGSIGIALLTLLTYMYFAGVGFFDEPLL